MEPTELVFKQRRFYARLTFKFEPERLLYGAKLSNSNSTTPISYGSIQDNTWELTEKNEWFRNAGFIWLGIGVFLEVVPMFTSGYRLPFWTAVGLICLGIYYFRQIHYTVVEASGERILVIKDEQHDSILETLFAKRKEYVRKHAGEISFENAPTEEIKRFEWLKENGFFSEEEYEAKKKAIEDHHKRKPVRSPLSP